MRNLKRVLSLALALVMVLGMMVITTSAATYADEDEITQIEAVEVLSAIGMVGGDGTNFNPNGTFTREAAAKLITYMLIGDMAEKLAGTDVFTDVKADRWSAGYIAYCANLGYITGVGDGKFNPSGVLTDIELGKLVLCALGYDPAKYTGANWATAVTVDMLDAELVKNVTGTAISREDACAMMLTAMKKGNEVTVYQVEIDGEPIDFDNLNDAILYCALGDGEYLGEYSYTTDSLLEKVYEVEAYSNTDDFGRTANIYEKAGWTAPMVYATAKSAKVYTDKAFAKTVAADLAGYKADGFKVNNTYEIEDDTLNIVVFTDGEPTPIAATEGTVAAAIADLTGDNKTVEIYANPKKEITKIVVVESHYDYIDEVTKADADKDIEASVELGCGETFKTDAFAEDDIVVYTYANDKVQTLTLAESFTGTMTTYNSDGEFTIDGEVYEVAFNGGVNGFDETNVIAQMGKEQVYYVGQNGKLIACENVGVAPVVITDYVLVSDSNVKTTVTEWPTETITASTAQIAGTLSDGTSGVFDLAVSKAAKGDNKGHFVTKINNVEVVVEEDGAIDDIEGVYTYTLDGNTITLVKKLAVLENNDDKNVVEVAAVDGVTNATAEVDGIIYNDKTVFILNAAGPVNQIVVKTGIAALEGTTVTGVAVVNASYNAKAPEGSQYTNVAAVVYATAVDFVPATSAVDTDDYIYVDGTYVVTKDTDDEDVYTYTGVKADGTKISVIGEDDEVTAGIYNFNAKGEIADVDPDALTAANAAIVDDVTVGTIAGTSVKLGDTFRTVDNTTKVVVVAKDAALEKGATVTYVYNELTNVVALIYVTEAAE